MLALADDVASLASSLLVLGVAFLVLPSVRTDSQPARALIFASMVALAWRYMVWRFTVTTSDLEISLEALVSWTFAIFEAATILSSTTAFLILSRTQNRTAEVERQLGWWQATKQPRVDVLIATYNEEAAILERTILGAVASSHPNTRVWVLDDGRRSWLDELSTRLGARYLARSDNQHAKAGNINAALAVLRDLPDPPDFVSVLDADFVPHRNFVPRMLALFHDG
ncbi:MAG: glycosyltransferase, partial [Planctomycetaceae bacterium]|nr:glycosyltransferase [Planctomycetaceae bacterium]